MTVQEVPAVLQCRYRLATGCTAEYGSKQGMYAHEKQGPAHADHRVTLRDCPVCGTGCGDEPKRGMHLSNEHGITAGSERRQELDARQVKELYDEQCSGGGHAFPAGALEVLDATANVLGGHGANGAQPSEPGSGEDLGPSLNGHGPAVFDDLSAARDMFVALVAEVETLRAAVAELEPDAARYRQIKSMVAKD